MARQRIILTLLWWGWGLLLVLLLVALSYQPAIFGEDPKAAWDWFTPHILPTMMLVGAAAYAKKDVPLGTEGHGQLFIIALVASIIYLLLLTIALLSVFYVVDPLAALRKASLWLGLLQGLCASALSVFFTK